MTNKTIPALTAATLPVVGTELLPIWDGVATVQVTISALGPGLAGIAPSAITGTALVSAAIGTTVQAYDADLTTWAGITPGTGVGTALAVAVGTDGAFVVKGGALGTPSSGIVTNLTGTASININGTVGATTANTGKFVTITITSTSVGGSDSYLIKADSGIGDQDGATLYIDNYGPAATGRSDQVSYGKIHWRASQPTSGALQDGAYIEARAEGYQGGVNTPTTLYFGTAPSGGGAATDHVVINSIGVVALLSTLDATSTTAASLVTAGGLGVAKKAAFGTGISVGGATPGAGGIAFPATAVAVADANTLDDYAEGTWTPNQGAGLTLVGAFSSSGSYTKIGRQVAISGTVSGATSIALAAAGAITTNLPFTVGIAGHGNVTNAAVTSFAAIICTSTSVTSAGAIAATASLTFSATYFV